MKKSIKFLSVLLFGGAVLFAGESKAAEPNQTAPAAKKNGAVEASTRNDAVIFKIHDINPISEDGIVTGCDFTVTLYNRTAINFRSFTVNMQWKDIVDERFKFDRYVESILSPEELAKEKQIISDDETSKPLQTAVTVNAFGADKQISIRSHVNNEKCYLMLSEASYTVSPCDIARSINSTANRDLDNKDCTQLFQMVNTSNPEYFGQFKKLSATEIAAQNTSFENDQLSDIDTVIDKIVENLGTSDKTLTNIN